VHETLSQEGTERVDFDQVAQRVMEMVEASLVRPDRPVRFSLNGSAGDLPSDIATPLSLILTELIQNAVEHAFPGKGGSVTVELKRAEPGVIVSVRDDGAGLPEGFDLTTTKSLGLQIVQTLVTELGGTIGVSSDGGTTAELSIPIAP
jgi:two-component sensor histidine kinase